MDSNDARDSLESGDGEGGGGGGGGGARCRCGNGRRKAAAVIVIQSLLTAACAALSLIVYLSQQPGSSNTHDTGIYMHMINLNSGELEFMTIWNQSVALNDKKRMKLSCGGPYMVYLRARVRNIRNDVFDNLTMEIGNETFHLQIPQYTKWKEMQKVIMLNENNEITVKVKHNKDAIRINELFLGLQYMLGAQCFHFPDINGS